MADTEDDIKYAIRVLRRLENGTVGVFYVDAMTGDTLDSLDGYELVSTGNLEGGNEVEDEDGGDESPSPFKGRGGGISGGGGGGTNFLQDALPWSETLIPQLFPSTASWFGGEKAKAVEEKVKKSGGVIQPARPSQNSKQPTNQPLPNLDKDYTGPAPGAMDMGRGLTSVPPVLAPQSTPSPSRSSKGSDTLEEKAGLQLTPNSSGEARQQSYYGTDDPYYNFTPETRNIANAVADDTEAKNINSGFRNPEHNDAVDGATNSLHKEGKSFDLNLDGLSDQEKSDVVSNLAFLSSVTPNTDVNLGFYSGSNVIHVDSQGRFDPEAPEKTGGLSVMMDRTRLNGAENKIPDWAMSGLQQPEIDKWAPIPGEKPVLADATGEPARTNDGRDRAFSETPGDSILSRGGSVGGLETNGTVAEKIIDSAVNPVYNDDDLTNAGTAASYGLSRVPDATEIDGLARTFAGELGPNTLAGIVNNDPAALAELASMVSTYENRLQSGSEDVLRGSQYNSNLASNKAVTDGNYAQYGGALNDSIGAFYQGDLAGKGNTQSTHYYGDYVNPSWASAMEGTSQFDSPHIFGNIPGEYETNVGFLDSVREVGGDRVNRQVSESNTLGRGLDTSPLSSPPSIADSGGGQFDTSSYYGSDGSNDGAGYNTPSGLGGSGSGGGFTVGDIAASLGGDSGGGQFDSNGSSSGSSTGGYTGGSSDTGSWGQGGGNSSPSSGSSSSSGGSYDAGVSAGGATDDYFSGW